MTEPFRFRFRARLVSVHDGDTVTLEVDLGGDVRASWPIRLLETWAPELNQPGGQLTGLFTHDWLAERSVGKWPFLLETFKTSGDRDKKTFERYLGVVTDAVTGDELNRAVNTFVALRGYGGGSGS